MRTSTLNKPNDKPFDLDRVFASISITHKAKGEMTHDLKTDKITIILHNENGEVLMHQIAGDEFRKFAYKTENDLQHLAENS